MVAITRDDGSELIEDGVPSSAVAGVVHGVVLVAPLWTLVASVVVVAFVR